MTVRYSSIPVSISPVNMTSLARTPTAMGFAARSSLQLSSPALRHVPITAASLSTFATAKYKSQHLAQSSQGKSPARFASQKTVVAPSTSKTPATSIEHGTDTRPISPHVQIYNFPLPAIMSVTNRFTGLGLSVGTTAFAALALFGSCDIPSYIYSFQQSVPLLVPVAKILVAGPFVWHYAIGMRHLYWDFTAKGIDLESQFNSARLIMGSAAVLTLAAAFVTLG